MLTAALRVVPGNQLTLANSDLASVGTLQDIAVESRRAAQREKPMLWLPKLVAVIRRVPTNDVDLEVRHLVHHGSACTPPKGDPYLARHCRRNMVGSPPRGVPVVVDYR